MTKTPKKNSKKPKSRLHKLFKLQHHRHTGKRTAHANTSYLALMLLLLVGGWIVKPVYPLLGDTLSVSGLVHVNVTVTGPPPTNAPSFTAPPDRTTFTVPLTSLTGNCDPNLSVKVFINGVFAGSALCDSGGTFILGISLVPGTNQVVAYVYDNLDQAGPPSATLTLFYNPPTPAVTHGSGGPGNVVPKPKPFRITTTESFHDILAGKPFSWQQIFDGGTPPYTFTVNWGDLTSNTYTVDMNGPFQLTHTYALAGTYHITVQVRDALGNISVMNLTVVVTGAPVGTKLKPRSASIQAPNAQAASFYDQMIMFMYKFSLLLVAAFWAIEKFIQTSLAQTIGAFFS